jgi:translocation and assembly module TamA
MKPAGRVLPSAPAEPRPWRGLALSLACAGVLAWSADARAATRELVVDAPSPFKALLEKNLDIERAARLAEADSLDDTEWARLVAAAPAQGRALAQTEGYFRADVSVAVDPADAHRILIKLVPGEPASVGRFTLEFDGELARQAESGDTKAMDFEVRLRDEWALQKGQVFRNGNWDSAKAQTLNTLRNEGYAAALWTATAAQVDPATDKARLFLVVDTGPRFLSGHVVVEGIERQSERNVRLLAGFGAGTPLTQARLLDYQDRLQKTGLYDQVAVVYDPDPTQAAHATVTVRVHEQSLHQATVALGYNSQSKARVTLEHTDRQVFGLPATSYNKLQWGKNIQEWDSSVVTHPAESFHSWLGGISVSRILSTGDDVRAASVRFGRTQQSNPLDRSTYAQFERSVQCNVPAAIFNIDQYCVDARALSLNQANIWRNVDSVVLPTKGWTFSGQVGVGWAGGPKSAYMPDAGYGPYTRLYGRLTEYWPLPDSFFARARVELGQIVVKDNVAMPDAQQWRAGGEDSVRGYEWRSLAPTNRYDATVGGNSLLTGSFEVAHPFTASLPSVWWAVFVDGGNAALRFSKFDMELGYGVGVRWRSPVGPLNIDVSFPDDFSKPRLDLSVGVAF